MSLPKRHPNQKVHRGLKFLGGEDFYRILGFFPLRGILYVLIFVKRLLVCFLGGIDLSRGVFLGGEDTFSGLHTETGRSRYSERDGIGRWSYPVSSPFSQEDADFRPARFNLANPAMSL